MNESSDAAAAALRQLDEGLTQSVMLPPIDSVIRRADRMNRNITAATAAVLIIGALAGVTSVAQSVVPGAVPRSVPVTLAPRGAVIEQLTAPTVAQVPNPGQQLVRPQPKAAPPAGTRLISHRLTVLAPRTRVPAANKTRTTRSDSNGKSSDNNTSSSDDGSDTTNSNDRSSDDGSDNTSSNGRSNRRSSDDGSSDDGSSSN